jgi:hypothetical protein
MPAPSPLNASTNIRTLYVSSFTTTPNAVLAEFTRQLNSEPWKVEHTDLEELKKEERKAHERDDALKTAYTLRRIWAEGGTLYGGVGGRDGLALRGIGNGNGEGGLELEGLEGVVRRVIAKQTAE